MAAVYLRVTIGFVVMAAVCFTAWRIGDRPVRRAALIISIAWLIGSVGQVLFRRQAEPILAGDAISGLGLLRLAWTYDRRWIRIVISVETALFFMHAAYYPPPPVLGAGERWANNVLSTTGLAVILAAALVSKTKRRSR